MRLGYGLLLVVALALPASGATLRVPSEYPTIQAGVDAAVAGDSVLVAPGTYTDVEVREVPIGGDPTAFTACVFLKGGITLVGEGGPSATEVVHPAVGSGRVVMILGGDSGPPVTISGFTMRGGLDTDALIGSIAGGLVLRDCVVEGMTSAASTAAVDVRFCDLTAHDTVFRDTDIGRVIYAPWSNLDLRRCRFEDNTGTSIGAVASEFTPYTAVVEDCVFEDTGGSALNLYSEVRVERNVFRRIVEQVVALRVGRSLTGLPLTGTIRFNLFENCATTDVPFKTDLLGGEISFNTFSGNSGGTTGAATMNHCDGVLFRNNIIEGTEESPAVWLYGEVEALCNDFWNNAAGDHAAQYPEDAMDLFLDPLFCDPEAGDFHLREDSPLVAHPECGPVGAFGAGCGTVSVTPESWGKIKADYR